MTKHRTILWVDDDISRLRSYVRALERADYKVITADSGEVAVEAAIADKPNVVLSDIRMPPPDGIETLRRLRKICPGAVFAAFSGYLYLHRYREALTSLDFPVQLLDKDFPNVQDATFKMRFLDPIAMLFDKGVTYTISDGKTPRYKVEGIDPFSVEFSDFMAMPIAEKDSLVTEPSE